LNHIILRSHLNQTKKQVFKYFDQMAFYVINDPNYIVNHPITMYVVFFFFYQMAFGLIQFRDTI